MRAPKLDATTGLVLGLLALAGLGAWLNRPTEFAALAFLILGGALLLERRLAAITRLSAAGDHARAAKAAARLRFLSPTARLKARLYQALASPSDAAEAALKATDRAAWVEYVWRLGQCEKLTGETAPLAAHAERLVAGGALSEAISLVAQAFLSKSLVGLKRARRAALPVLAGVGDVVAVLQLSAELRLTEPERALWEGAALMAAGLPRLGAVRLDAGAFHAPSLKRQAEARRAWAPAPLTEADQAALLVITGELTTLSRLTWSPKTSRWVWAVAVGLLGAFGLQAAAGGTESPETAARLGALLVTGGWPPLSRLLTFGWLHLGPLHLGINLAGLAVFGPLLVQVRGRAVFLACWLGGIIGSGLIIARFGAHGLTLGASGAVLALVGALWMTTLRARCLPGRAARLGLARFLGAMIALQVGLDAINPEVSSAGHLGGLAVGMLISWAARCEHG